MRQALDALDAQRGRVLPEGGNNGDRPQSAEITAIVEVPESVTSQFDFERQSTSR